MPGTFGEDYDWRDFPQLRAGHDLWMQRLEQVLPKEVFYALSDEEKQNAYTVARLWDDRARTEALYSIRDAILQGKTVRQWRKDSWDELADKYGKAGAQAPWYRDVVFRTNTQTAFAGGRYADMFSSDGVVQAPFWMFSAIHDARTRPTHAALDGKVFRKDDPAARRYLPPLGFNCRCSAIGLDDEDVRAAGYKVMNGAEIPAIPLEDGSGMVGPPEKGWDADRVQTTVPKALGSGSLQGDISSPGQDPPAKAETLADALRELGGMKTRERGYLFGSDGARLAVVEGTLTSVNFGTVPVQDRFGATPVHNHLGGEGPSLSDGMYAIQNNAPEAYVVAPGGLAFVIRPPAAGWGDSAEARYQLSIQFRDAWLEARWEWQQRTGLVLENTPKGFHEVLLAVAAELGLDYRVEVVGGP